MEKKNSLRRDWGWRCLLGTSIGTAAGVLCGSAALASGLWVPPRGALRAVTINAAIASASLAGAEELIRELRSADVHDSRNSFLGGAATGYTLGTLQGGKRLALSSAIAFSVLGILLHKSVWAVQDWRLLQIQRAMGVDEAAPDTFDASITDASPASPASGQQGKSPVAESKSKWSWPEWMPIRPATPAEIKRNEEMRARREKG